VQARVEAQSVFEIMKKYDGLHSEEDRWRAIMIKEKRADLAKQHLWVLWTDYFKPEHIEQYPQLHDLFWRATKQAGATKKTVDPTEGQKLLGLIDEIAEIFWATKK
jgi:nickel superoxide dismutase